MNQGVLAAEGLDLERAQRERGISGDRVQAVRGLPRGLREFVDDRLRRVDVQLGILRERRGQSLGVVMVRVDVGDQHQVDAVQRLLDLRERPGVDHQGCAVLLQPDARVCELGQQHVFSLAREQPSDANR